MLSPYFARGDGPLVSVCIPSRGRPEHLLAAIDSCERHAHNPEDLEFIIKLDEDDDESVVAIEDLSLRRGVQIVSSPRGNGFLDIHHWYNDLILPAATGDWLLLFNDDARMKTQNWDKRIHDAWLQNFWHGTPSDVCALAFKTNGNSQSNEFIAIRRKTCEIMGRVFGSPYGDSWLVRVMEMVESLIRLDSIEIGHLRETVKDETRANTDAGFKVGIGSITSVPAILSKMADVTKLLSHIQAKESAVNWGPYPEAPGWYRWRQNIESRAINCLVFADKTVFPPDIDGETKTFVQMGGMWWPMV